jgi:hypothetical protein
MSKKVKKGKKAYKKPALKKHKVKARSKEGGGSLSDMMSTY